jgi:hypothetical protein
VRRSSWLAWIHKTHPYLTVESGLDSKWTSVRSSW